jgi:hypothetical protein
VVITRKKITLGLRIGGTKSALELGSPWLFFKKEPRTGVLKCEEPGPEVLSKKFKSSTWNHVLSREYPIKYHD